MRYNPIILRFLHCFCWVGCVLSGSIDINDKWQNDQKSWLIFSNSSKSTNYSESTRLRQVYTDKLLHSEHSKEILHTMRGNTMAVGSCQRLDRFVNIFR